MTPRLRLSAMHTCSGHRTVGAGLDVARWANPGRLVIAQFRPPRLRLDHPTELLRLCSRDSDTWSSAGIVTGKPSG